MSTAELKNKLKDKIDSLNESYLLEELLDIIDLETNSEELFEIPEQHKKELGISLKQKEDGEVISHDTLMKELENGFRD